MLAGTSSSLTVCAWLAVQGVICSSAGNHAQVGCLWDHKCSFQIQQGECFAAGIHTSMPAHHCMPSSSLLGPCTPQGVALAARTLGCSAIICMPTNAPVIKIDAVRELGGTVELVGESFFEAQQQAQVWVGAAWYWHAALRSTAASSWLSSCAPAQRRQ